MTQEDRPRSENKEKLFNGREFLVTGAANGIGKAITQEAHNLGAAVTGVDIKESNDVVIADITDTQQLSRVAKVLKTSGKKIDHLILSAGITQNEPGQVDEEEWQRINRVNAQGTQNSFNAFKDLLADNATVVFLSSDLINDPNTRLPAYTESKRAIAEFASQQSTANLQLRILILLPGPVDTELFRWKKPPQVADEIIQKIGLHPEEFAKIVLKDILPNTAKYPTGSQIRIYKNELEVIIPKTVGFETTP